MKRIVFILVSIPLICFGQKESPTIQEEVWSLTEVMFHDVVNPPAAARFYSYCLLTGYEVYFQLDTSALSFQNKFKDYPKFSLRNDHSQINIKLAVLYGILETGKSILPSGYLLERKQEDLTRSLSGLPQQVIDSSVAFAKRISKAIVSYSKTDGYFKLSTFSRYRPLQGESYWQPTPPDYMSAVEPHWQTIRTFFLDSVQQCQVKPMISFDTQTESAFYRLANEVYVTSKNLSEEQKAIAGFWDCNPFAVQFQGHMSVGLKKISPGGHWMGITGIVCEQAKLDFKTTLLLHTIIALTLHDAFVCCWNGKYNYNRIRPETVINRYIDERWQPFLQTPPFPEYPSGHSVISTASAKVLTYLLGDHFAFTDSVETYLGLPSRKFHSFNEAAQEARISRLYGGIHFRDAIEYGADEGQEIGDAVIQKSSIRKLGGKASN